MYDHEKGEQMKASRQFSSVDSAFSWNANQYDAINNKTKRRSSGQSIESHDNALGTHDRFGLIEGARDIQRNFSAGAYMIRKHLDYVSDFSFQPKTGDRAVDDRLSELMDWWMEPENCDVSGRHDFSTMFRLSEMHRTVDGDVFWVKIDDGRLQLLESDRVQNIGGIGVTEGSPVKGAQKIVHGVHVDKANRALAYDVFKKKRISSYTYDRTLRARNVIQHGYYDNYDQVRGVSPLVSAIPMFVDTLEMQEYARMKAKVSQYFALAIKRAAPEYGINDNCSEYEIDFGLGPQMLDLDPGDEADFLESDNPGTEFQAFIQLCLQIAAKALDMPWSFFDESFTNYSGSRIAMLQYVKSTKDKRKSNLTLLKKITRWKIAQWQLAGYLPKGDLRQFKFDWIAGGVPWFDMKNEAEADILLIQNGIKTRREVRQERMGDEWNLVAEELARENEMMSRINAPMQPAPQEQPTNETE